MRHLRFTLFADGPTDRALVPILDWLIRETHRVDTINPEFYYRSAFNRSLSFSDRLRTALSLAPCEILFIHRDAERQPPQLRYDESTTAIAAMDVAQSVTPHVCVVPVRMTEAWLLFDETAIRKAAGRPRSDEQLHLPRLSQLEGNPDPKTVLYELLRAASGKRGRRRASFDVREAAALVPEYVTSFAPLRQLNSFARLESDLRLLNL